MTRPTITAAAALAPGDVVTAAAVESATVSTTSRTIVGTIVVWDQVGHASVGASIFASSSVQLPADLRRVKLLLDHDRTRPVGYLLNAEQTATGIVGTFYVPPGELGDLALAQARDGLRDGLSPGAYITAYHFDDAERVVVEASELYETSLVAVPAFADARVSSVTASRKDSSSMDENEQQTGAQQEQQPAAQQQQEQQPAAPAATPPATTVVVNNPAPANIEAQLAQATATAVRSAGTSRPAQRGLDLRAMSSLVVDHLRAERPAAGLPQVIEAALNDVTPVNITNPANTEGYGPRRPQYVDDLWTAAAYPRPTVDAFGPPKQLTSLEVAGWVWDVRPQVGRYSGNKAEVPSNQPKRKRVKTSAQRFAGGWDIDRAFVDLPGPSSTSEVEDVFVEATKSYQEQSEDYAAELVGEAATALPVTGPMTVPAALARLGTYFSTVKGSRIGYIAMGTEAWEQFANMSNDDAPWWLRNLGTLNLGESTGEAGYLRFVANPDLPGTQILAADKRAVTLWEVAPPIRVQALDVPRGGVDLGVFGYFAGLVTDPRVVVTLDTSGPAAG